MFKFKYWEEVVMVHFDEKTTQLVLKNSNHRIDVIIFHEMEKHKNLMHIDCSSKDTPSIEIEFAPMEELIQYVNWMKNEEHNKSVTPVKKKIPNCEDMKCKKCGICLIEYGGTIIREGDK